MNNIEHEDCTSDSDVVDTSSHPMSENDRTLLVSAFPSFCQEHVLCSRYLVTARSVLLMVLLVIVSSCSPESIPVTRTPTSTSRPISTLGPTPTAPPLGAVPQNCPPGPRPQNIFADIIPVIGSFPVWAAGFVGPHAILHIGNGKSTQNNVYTQHGWYRKILWRVSRNSPSPVTLHGSSLRDGTPLWFQIGDQDPTLSPVLDPGTAGEQPWTSFPSYIFIPQAGCYYLEAHWSSGSWRITFAAGL